MSDLALRGREQGQSHGAFRHEALLYDGGDAFLDGTVPFIEAGLAAGEPVMVAVTAQKIESLCDALGADAGRVSFVDMAEVGRNPARIIPAWRQFLAEHEARPALRGVGEPVWPERTPEELAECQGHEALLNVAFAGRTNWQLRCPYDTSSLGPDVVGEARKSHRFLTDGRHVEESRDYRGDGWSGGQPPLQPAPAGSPQLNFGRGPLDGVRQFVHGQLDGALGAQKLSDLLVAVGEVAANSVVHGGGAGTVRLWRTAGAVVCEVSDRGWIRQPLVGRCHPHPDMESGRGLWMVNQLCDLVQLRSSSAGTVVRLHMGTR